MADPTVQRDANYVARPRRTTPLDQRDLLRRSKTSTYCNYKGVATYWSAVSGDDRDNLADGIAWSYPDPPPESRPIKGLLSFDATRADVLAELPA